MAYLPEKNPKLHPTQRLTFLVRILYMLQVEHSVIVHQDFSFM